MKKPKHTPEEIRSMSDRRLNHLIADRMIDRRTLQAAWAEILRRGAKWQLLCSRAGNARLLLRELEAASRDVTATTEQRDIAERAAAVIAQIDETARQNRRLARHYGF